MVPAASWSVGGAAARSFEIISETLSADEFNGKIRDDRIEIVKVIERKRRRGCNDDQKLIQYLLRLGFSNDLIREMI